MTVVVTRNVAARMRGFLASCMLEIAPGVYTSPKMTSGVRDRVWTVCEGWFDELSDASVIMTWRDAARPGGQGVLVLGLPPKELCDHEGMLLTRAPLPSPTKKAEDQRSAARD